MARQVELYPNFAKTGSTFLHDPLAAALVVEPRLCDVTPMHVDVETEGKYGTGVTFMRPPTESAPANAGVALDGRPAPTLLGNSLQRFAANLDWMSMGQSSELSDACNTGRGCTSTWQP